MTFDFAAVLFIGLFKKGLQIHELDARKKSKLPFLTMSLFTT